MSETDKLQMIEMESLKGCSTSTAIVLINPHNKISYINPGFLKAWDINNGKDVIDSSIHDFWVIDEQFDEMKSTVANLIEWKGKLKAKRKDRSFFYVTVIATPLLNQDDILSNIMLLCLNIKETDEARKKIPQENMLLNEMSRIAKIGAWEFDVETLEGNWTAETARIYDLDPGLSINVEDGKRIYVDESKKIIEKAVSEAIVKGKSYDLELQIVTSKGNHKWVRTIGHPVKEDGKVIRVQGTLQDISERKQFEESVFKNQKLLKDSQRIAKMGSWELDLSTLNLRWNKEACQIYGVDTDLEITLETFNEIVHKDDRKIVEKHFAETMRTKCFKDFECRIITPAGIMKYIIVAGEIILDETENPIFLYGIVQDITERKMTENIIRESESRYRTLFEFSSDAILIISGETISNCNQKALEIFECNRDQIIGKTPAQLSPTLQPDNRRSDQRLTEIINDVIAGNPRYFEWLQEKPNGELFEAEVSLSLLKLADSSYTMAIIRDVTEKNRIMKSLQESEARLREAQKLAHLGYWIVDIKTGKVKWSDEIYEIFQLDPKSFTPDKDSIIAQSPWPKDRERDEKIFQETINSKKPGSYEQRFLRPDGSIGYYFSRFQGIYDDTGELLEIKGTIQDITKRKQQELELSRLRNYLSSIIDSMPSILVGVDPEGKVTQWNREASVKTGFSYEKVIGRPLEEVLPRLKQEMPKIYKAIDQQVQQSDLNRSYLEDGQNCYEDITIYPLIAEGVEGAVIRIDDVSERVRIEEMMVQSEKMLSIGGLAAGMAHEINNPLGGMMQTAQVLKNRLTNTKISANIRAAEEVGVTVDAINHYMEKRGILKMLNFLHDSGLRAAGIVRNMLSFAKKSNKTASPQNIPRLVDRCIELCGIDYDLKKDYDFKKIKIIREYESSLPEVPCEESKIQQVIINILKNGAEAMVETNRQSTFTLRIFLIKEAGQIAIEIEDNGPGIPEDIRKRIFEPFFTTKPTNRGTGLGLSVSYFIITENHKGEMFVNSIPDKGTVFTIRLPLS